MPKSNYVKCKCGWIHFGVSWDYALTEVHEFNFYFSNLSRKEQIDFYGGKPSSLLQYMHCGVCNAHFSESKKATKKDIKKVYGSTIGPIIWDGQ